MSMLTTLAMANFGISATNFVVTNLRANTAKDYSQEMYDIQEDMIDMTSEINKSFIDTQSEQLKLQRTEDFKDYSQKQFQKYSKTVNNISSMDTTSESSVSTQIKTAESEGYYDAKSQLQQDIETLDQNAYMAKLGEDTKANNMHTANMSKLYQQSQSNYFVRLTSLTNVLKSGVSMAGMNYMYGPKPSTTPKLLTPTGSNSALYGTIV